MATLLQPMGDNRREGQLVGQLVLIVVEESNNQLAYACSEFVNYTVDGLLVSIASIVLETNVPATVDCYVCSACAAGYLSSA